MSSIALRIIPAVIFVLLFGCVHSADTQNKSTVQVVPQLGHSGNVESVALSPDSRFALSGGHDNLVKLWDVAAGKELRTFRGHTGTVTSVAFSLTVISPSPAAGRTGR